MVTKLFHIVEPDAAFFGKKDYQQWRVIQRMVRRYRGGAGREGEARMTQTACKHGMAWHSAAWRGMELAFCWCSVCFLPRHPVSGHACSCHVSCHACRAMPCPKPPYVHAARWHVDIIMHLLAC